MNNIKQSTISIDTQISEVIVINLVSLALLSGLSPTTEWLDYSRLYSIKIDNYFNNNNLIINIIYLSIGYIYISIDLFQWIMYLSLFIHLFVCNFFVCFECFVAMV